jgi:succinate-acetate transporter protein
VQLIKGNTFGGTAFASYGAFWMGWGLLEYLMKTTPSAYPTAHTGKTLWCGLWAILTLGERCAWGWRAAEGRI